MPLAFSNPLALLLVPLVPLSWWLARRSLADLSDFRRRLAVGLRSAVLGCLILGVAGTQLVFRSTKVCTLFVVDCSDSVPPAARKQAIEFINKAVTNMRSGDTAGVIAFGSDAYVDTQVQAAPKLGELQTVVDPSFTDIAQAVRLAMAAFDEDAQKRVVLFSDGNENLGRAVDDATIAEANGVRIDVVPITPPEGPEVLLDKMVMPGQVKIGEPFEAKIVAISRQTCDARLTLYRDGVLIKRQAVSLVKGDNVYSFTDSLEKPDFVTYEAHIEALQDTSAENNRALGFTFVRGKPKVLYVEGDPGESGYLARALSAERIDVDVRGLAGIPTEIGDFQQYDSVVLSDVPAYAMSDAQLGMIRSNVRDLGIGLVMIGGESSFGAGGYLGTPVEDALPVTMDISKKKYVPSGAIVLVMHAIEFPQGDYWARKTCLAVLDTLSSQDKMGVLHYGMREQWLFALQRVTNKSKLRALINSMTTGDMPDYGSTLQLAYDALAGDKESRVKHIVILSDGDATPPTKQLVQKIQQAGITLSTVCIQPHTQRDWTSMQAMAGWGSGRAYRVTNGNQVPKLFLKEAKVVRKSAIIEEKFNPAVTDPGDEILKGVDLAMPRLYGYVSTTIKERAAKPLVCHEHDDDPVLAHWRYDLGRSVAFTSDCKKRWAAEWVQWSHYSKIFAQMVRWTMRRGPRSDFQVQVLLEAGQGKVVVDAIDKQGNFINFLDIEARVVGPGLESSRMRLDQTAPGRYEGAFEAREVGQYVVNLSSKDEKGDIVTQTTGAVVPYSPEFRDLKANQYLLSRLTDITHGRVLKEPQEVFGADRVGARRSQAIWWTLLMAAILLLPLDIAVRRIMFDKREFVQARERAAAYARGLIPTRRPRAEPVHTATLGRLLGAKDRALEEHEAPAEAEAPAARPATVGPPAGATPVTPSRERVRPGAREAEPEHEPEPATPADMMARLRAARERARRKMEEK